MITGYNPLMTPQMANPLSKTEPSPSQAGQIPSANSNFFASVITQLLMQMELQSETDSGIDSTNPSLFLGNNQTIPQTGGNIPGNQPNNPYDMTQMMGSAFSTMPLNVSDLLNNLGYSSYNTQLTDANTQNPPGPYNSLNVPSINPYTMMEANNPSPASNTDGSLQFHAIDPNQLNEGLGGKLKGMGEVFVKAGQQFNVDPALLAAIAQHETGNGKSEAAYTKNNIAGMMGTNGLKSYASVEDSIMDMARNVGKYYLGSGLSTISKIGAKYAPVGAGNDPSGLNNYWVTGVTHYYNQLRTPTVKTNTFTSTV